MHAVCVNTKNKESDTKIMGCNESDTVSFSQKPLHKRSSDLKGVGGGRIVLQ